MPRTILLADDSATVRTAVQLILAKNEHFTLLTAKTADEARELLKTGKPDLLVVDHALMSDDLTNSGIPILSPAKPFDAHSFMGALQEALPTKQQQHKAVEADFQLPISRDRVEEIIRQKIEEIAWEVVPELAESIIREEIKRLTQSQANP